MKIVTQIPENTPLINLDRAERRLLMEILDKAEKQKREGGYKEPSETAIFARDLNEELRVLTV